MTQPTPDTRDDTWLTRSRETVARFDLAPQAETVGRVERVGDGIALVSGLPDACLNELLRFDGGRMGFALPPRDDRTTIGCYRQVGLNVHLIASRWAQATRETSGRLEEAPGRRLRERRRLTNDASARSLTNDRHGVARGRQLRQVGDAIGARNSGDLTSIGER
jgi:F0F1-type ATP synthase alpha subunit